MAWKGWRNLPLFSAPRHTVLPYVRLPGRGDEAGIFQTKGHQPPKVSDQAGLHPIDRTLVATYDHRMNTKTFFPAKLLGLVLSAALLPMLFGCVADSSRSSVRVHASSGYTRTDVIMEDDYVYYPGYEVYYSSNRHSYIYRDGRNWVTRPAPPRVAIEVLLASPSLRVDFRDSPERHHADMVKRYPRNWRPAGDNHEVRKERSRDEKDKDHRDRKDERDDHDRKRD